MLTTALRPLTVSCVRHHPSHKVHLFSSWPPLPLIFGQCVCDLCVVNEVLSSTRLKAFCSSPIVFTPMDPDITPDSPDGCIGRGPALALGTPAVRWRKPRRLRQEGAVGVAIMITDTRGPWHADMVRSVAARPRGAKCATGLPSLVLTRRRLELTDAGRKRGTWLARVVVSSIASRYSLWISGLLLGHGSVALTCACGIMDPRALLKIL